jgi:uncharacterized membrane protein
MKRWFLVLPLLVALAGCGDSDAELAALAAQDKILASAPLQFEGQVTINAPPDKVFAVLADVQDWPNWQRDIAGTAIGIQVGVGTPFAWETGGVNIHSVLQRYIPGQSIAWTGTVVNFHAIHIFDLAPGPNGTTIVTMRESMTGFLVKYFYSNAQLAQSDQHWFAYLKAAAEGRPPPGL